MPTRPVQETILIFTKYPLPGKSKTRLIPLLGAEKAAALQQHMTELVLQNVLNFTCDSDREFIVYYQGGSRRMMKQWLGDGIRVISQQGQDLGNIMLNALCNHLRKGSRILLIGADCPSLKAEILQKAFTSLESHDLVLGPAHDGGYYLIGVNGDIQHDQIHILFEGIGWGGDQVLAQTLGKAKLLALSHYLLPQLHDIDRPEDLEHFHYHSNPE